MKREHIEAIRQAAVSIDGAWNNFDKPYWPLHIVRLIRTLAEQANNVADVMERHIEDASELYDSLQLNNELEEKLSQLQWDALSEKEKDEAIRKNT